MKDWFNLITRNFKFQDSLLVRCIGKKSNNVQSFYVDSVQELEDIIKNLNSEYHIYYGVLPRDKATEEPTGYTCIWLDMDTAKMKNADEVMEKIEDFIPSYTMKVNSGHGYHIYWILDNKYPEGEAQQVVKLAQKYFNSDPTWDSKRLLRVVGSKNIKDIPYIVELENNTNNIISLDTFKYSLTKRIFEECKEVNLIDTLSDFALRNLTDLLLTLPDDRSKVDFKILREMALYFKRTEVELYILPHLLKYDFPALAKIKERSGDAYLKRALDKINFISDNNIDIYKYITDPDEAEPLPENDLYLNFFEKKGKRLVFSPVKTGNWCIENLYIKKIYGDLYYYTPKTGLYSQLDGKMLNQLLSGIGLSVTLQDLRNVLGYITEFGISEYVAQNNTGGNIENASILSKLNRGKNIYEIPLKNGVFDIQKKTLREFTPEDIFLSKFNVEYDPDAKSEVVDYFLESIVPEEYYDLLLQHLGYVVFPEKKYKKMVIFYGTGDNGKTTLINLLTYMLGDAFVSNQSLHSLITDPYALATLLGKYLNTSSELANKDIRQDDGLKKLTGMDTINANRKFKDYVSFVNQAHLVFATNSIPPASGQSQAFFNRVHIIHFKSIPRDKIDPNLIYKLTKPQSLSAFFNKILEGVDMLLHNDGFINPPAGMFKFIYDMKYSKNSVVRFLEDNYFVDEEELQRNKKLHNYKLALNIYTNYKEYCKLSGYQPVSLSTFIERINEWGRDIGTGDIAEAGDNPKAFGKWRVYVGKEI